MVKYCKNKNCDYRAPLPMTAAYCPNCGESLDEAIDIVNKEKVKEKKLLQNEDKSNKARLLTLRDFSLFGVTLGETTVSEAWDIFPNSKGDYEYGSYIFSEKGTGIIFIADRDTGIFDRLLIKQSTYKQEGMGVFSYLGFSGYLSIKEWIPLLLSYGFNIKKYNYIEHIQLHAISYDQSFAVSLEFNLTNESDVIYDVSSQIGDAFITTNIEYGISEDYLSVEKYDQYTF